MCCAVIFLLLLWFCSFFSLALVRSFVSFVFFPTKIHVPSFFCAFSFSCWQSRNRAEILYYSQLVASVSERARQDGERKGTATLAVLRSRVQIGRHTKAGRSKKGRQTKATTFTTSIFPCLIWPRHFSLCFSLSFILLIILVFLFAFRFHPPISCVPFRTAPYTLILLHHFFLALYSWYNRTRNVYIQHMRVIVVLFCSLLSISRSQTRFFIYFPFYYYLFICIPPLDFFSIFSPTFFYCRDSLV